MLLVSFVGFWFFSVPSQEIGWEERLRNDLFCVEWEVKPCSLPYQYYSNIILLLNFKILMVLQCFLYNIDYFSLFVSDFVSLLFLCFHCHFAVECGLAGLSCVSFSA